MIYKTNRIKQTRKYGRKYKRNMKGGSIDPANKFLAQIALGMLLIGVLIFWLLIFSKGHGSSKSL